MPRKAVRELIHMPRGGARNRSGPQPDPNSLKSAKIGYTLTALPSEGFDGEVPPFPLSPPVVWWEYFEDKQKVRELDTKATAARRDRELELWTWAWRTPQACAWSLEPWRWQTVAMWVRTFALCESSEATAADKGSLHRFADQIGMTPAGLKENGWKIATDQVSAKRETARSTAAPVRTSARDRLKAIDGERSA
jgi:hypothetical protein